MWQGRSLDAALPRALRAIDDPSDRALARNIAAQALRWLTDLDRLIDARTKRLLPQDARARMVLRMALVQALVLKTPDHAVVATSLPLVEGGPRRLVHGVISAVLKAGEALPDRPTLPEPWQTRWAETWGPDTVRAAEESLAAPPPLDLSFAVDSVPKIEGTSLLPGHLRVSSDQRVEGLAGFDTGAFWVQDLAASLPARILDAQPAERVIDLCAAPGGKTMQLAAAGAALTSVDNSSSRLDRVRENLERTGLSADIVEADARIYSPAEPADAVLLDAPCSGTGIFRRHPDVLYLRDPERLRPTLDLQEKLLDHAATLVRAGGRLVYSVCSLEPEEGEAQVQAFLDRSPDWQVDEIPASALPEGLAAQKSGILRTTPGDLADQGGLDGFFVARLVRSAATG